VLVDGTYWWHVAIANEMGYGPYTALQSFQVATNHAPVFATAADVQAVPGDTVTVDLAATDEDSDPLSFHVLSSPAGGRLSGPRFWWVPGADQADSTYTVVFTVDDGRTGVDTASVLVHVQAQQHCPITLDLDGAPGDQGQLTAGSAVVGKRYILQFHIADVPAIRGWGLRVEYDSSLVAYVPDSFVPGAFPPSVATVAAAWGDVLTIGGMVLGGGAGAAGGGLLGTATFEVKPGFSGLAEIVMTKASTRPVGAPEVTQAVRSVVTITQARLPEWLIGDFNRDSRVDFDDFYLFADAFGSTDPFFDLNGDRAVDIGDFFIFADQFGLEARARLLAVAADRLGRPTAADLAPGYPNPFNAATTIRYHIPTAMAVRLAVYGVTGQLVRTLVESWQEPGPHVVTWDGRSNSGSSAATGVYLVRLDTRDGVRSGNVTLLR
jgi:hypothetical protein